ncbi:unnamed protein product, partial [Effrenium voratum]
AQPQPSAEAPGAAGESLHLAALAGRAGGGRASCQLPAGVRDAPHFQTDPGDDRSSNAPHPGHCGHLGYGPHGPGDQQQPPGEGAATAQGGRLPAWPRGDQRLHQRREGLLPGVRAPEGPSSGEYVLLTAGGESLQRVRQGAENVAG